MFDTYIWYLVIIHWYVQVVKKCNDGAKRMQQTEQMCHLVRNLEFKVKVGKLNERKKITTVYNSPILSKKAVMYLFGNFIKWKE